VSVIGFQTGHSEHVEQWLSGARDGSSEALGKILDFYRNYLLLVANRELDPELRAKGGASDLVQSVFLKAHRDFTSFRGSSEGEILAWLRTILVNHLTNFRRDQHALKRSVRREVPLGSLGLHNEPPGDRPSPSTIGIAREEVALLQVALDRLPDQYRMAIELRNQKRKTFPEMGDALDCSPEAARKLWARAVERLRQEMDRPQ